MISGLKPETFQTVAQCLNQLHYQLTTTTTTTTTTTNKQNNNKIKNI
jgi:hypothetical protein